MFSSLPPLRAPTNRPTGCEMGLMILRARRCYARRSNGAAPNALPGDPSDSKSVTPKSSLMDSPVVLVRRWNAG